MGNTVKEFASDNATVVVGTVIDPDMTGELRVTVVATGLGREHEAVSMTEKSVKLVVDKTNSGDVDYGQLDKPTVIRNKVAGDRFSETEGGMDYLDIPAFLRRQAD